MIKFLVISLVLCATSLLVGSCVPTADTDKAKGTTQVSLYDAEVEPLSSEECGKCHIRIFYLLKAAGAKHRFNCRRCHVKFHDYRPGVSEWTAVVPKCSQCHKEPHGPALVDCLACHSQPHTPLDIPANETLALGCDKCHPAADRDMKTFETQHTEFYCTVCHHTRHGYKPECFECHQPHAPEMTMADCLTCHPPHKAFEVIYPDDTPNEVCSLCHPQAYKWLKEGTTKHAKFRCTKCHPQKHRTIKDCKECHQPHHRTIVETYTVCGRCHGIAHSLVR